MDGRLTICNMVVEMGAKAGFMAYDEKTAAWLGKRKNHKRKITPVSPDKDARYEKVFEFDISKLLPQVSVPHNVDTVSNASRLKDVSINEAVIGTCTNGRLSDLKIVAKILRAHKIHAGVRCIVVPASSEIYLEALKLGYVETIIKAGAVIVAPGCGPCVGTHNGIPADGEIVISTANRNFKGRMGNPNAFIYLGSPATVVASAITGSITDPRKFL
jgi:3-isopropylmalate/(R)-2-methylmalate dehydratase large subunit